MGVEVRRRTDAPAERVHEVLADAWSYASWVVGASRVRAVDPSWPEVGARLHHSVGMWPLLIDDCTEVLERTPTSLRLEARGWPLGEAVVEVETEPRDDGRPGCVVVMREDASEGPGRFVPRPLRQAVLYPRNVESLRRLVLLAERQAIPQDDAEDDAEKQPPKLDGEDVGEDSRA